VNPRFCDVTGYAAAEVVGRRIHDLGELPIEQAVDIWATVSRGYPWRGEFLGTKKNGETYWVYSCISPITSETGEITNFLAVNLDISERKKAEDDLAARDAYYRTLLEDGADVIVVLGVDGAIRYVSPSVTRILGYDGDDLIGTRAFDLIHPDDVEDSIQSFARMISGVDGGVTAYQDRVRHADGSWRTVESVVRSLADGTGIVVNLRDVTERVTTEEALRQSEERFRMVTESMYDMVTVLDAAGKIVYQSPSAEATLGYAIEDRLGTETFEYVHPGDQALARQAFDELIDTPGSVRELQLRLKNNDGSWRILEGVAKSRFSIDGSPEVIMTSRDVTERVTTEEALRQSEERFRTVVESIYDVVSVVDATGAIEYQSPSVKRVLGYTAEERIGTTTFDYVHPDDLDEAREAFAELIGKSDGVRNLRLRARHKDGSWRVLESVARSRIDVDGSPKIIVTSRDVTERLESEDALRQSEASKQALLDAIPDLIFRQDREGRYLEFVPGRFEPVMPAERFLGKLMSDVLPQELTVPAMAAFERVLSTGNPETLEYDLKVADERRDFEARIVACGPDEVLTLVREITDQRRTESALKESEQRLRTLLHNAPVILFAWDKDGYFIASEGRGLERLGRVPGQVVGQHITDLYPKGSRIYENFRRALAGELITDEVQVGGRWFSAFSTPLKGADGNITGVIGVAMDISERRQAEQALKESQGRLREALDHAQMTAWEWDILSDEFIDSAGEGGPLFSESGPLNYADFMQRVMEDDRTRLDGLVRAVLEAGEGFETEFRIRFPDGETHWVLSNGAVTRDSAGKALKLFGLAIDITSRKQAEQALSESEERYRTLYQDNPSMYFTVSEGGIVLSVNQFGAAQLGYVPEELVGRSVFDVFHKSDRAEVRRLFASLAGTDGLHNWEFRKVRRDGRVIWVKETVRTVRDPGGATTYLVVCEDISERKRMEAAMQAMREQLARRAERAVSRGNVFGLSFRELTVLDLVARGKSDKEIAVVLGIRTGTASKHVSNVLKKMRAASRAEAGVTALREGLIR
jgi:PAS domain S-box-containing protein